MFEFIAGRPVTAAEVDPSLVGQAVRFCLQLQEVQTAADATTPPPAASSRRTTSWPKTLPAMTIRASFQLTSAMNRFRRDFLAAYISASSDPDTYGKITVLTIPGQVNGPKLAFNAISTDTAVSQDLGVIGRDNQNRIRWGNLLTLPVGQGGLLYVAPVYASPGASDAASSYPRLIRVAMLYNDKVGYGPTVSQALDGIFGAGAGATAADPGPIDRPTRRQTADRRGAEGPGRRGSHPAGGGGAPGRVEPVGDQGRRPAGSADGPGCGARGAAQRQLRPVRGGAAAPRRGDGQVRLG